MLAVATSLSLELSRNACGGADEVPEVAEGEAALKEALPLAEALDEVAMEAWKEIWMC